MWLVKAALIDDSEAFFHPNSPTAAQCALEKGGPLDPPAAPNNRSRKKSPLEYAIDAGFHSLVEVLLQAGASMERDGTFCPMELALSKRRFDVVQLLVDHGFDAASVNMESVFATWDPEIMEYFIQRGADVESEMPLAWALCHRTRTALGIFKKHREQFASFQEQANVALRHHCRNGNMKWVSLLIWAGADPLAPGEAEPGRETDPDDEGLSALGFAALYGHVKVFSLKKVVLPVDHPAVRQLVGYICNGEGLPLVEKLLNKGLDPNDQENGGCSVIQSIVAGLECYRRRDYFSSHLVDYGGDSEEAREKMKTIHLLAKHGGRWKPAERYELNAARRSLLKMDPDYTVEFAWIMERFGACEKPDIEALINTAAMKRHLGKRMDRLREVLSLWREKDGDRQEHSA